MSWILWGGSSEAPPAPKPCDPKQRKKDSPLPTENSDTVPALNADDANGDEGDYELEWDSWPMDLARQTRSGMDKHITVTIPEGSEPSSTHGPHLHDRFGIGRSTSNMSLSAQLGPVSPAVRHEILSSANMELLSVDSPALLTAPSVLPLQSSGVTTSTVSAGGVVRARSLMSVDRGRRRGVARAMDIPTDESGKLPCSRKQRAGKQKWTHEEHSLNASATSSMASMHSSGFSPTSTVRSTVSMLEVANDTASMPATVTTSTVTTSAPISSGSRRSSAAAETQRPDKGGKGKGLKSGLALSAERLMSKIESGWIS
jgi:hypothetical protein